MSLHCLWFPAGRPEPPNTNFWRVRVPRLAPVTPPPRERARSPEPHRAVPGSVRGGKDEAGGGQARGSSGCPSPSAVLPPRSSAWGCRWGRGGAGGWQSHRATGGRIAAAAPAQRARLRKGRLGCTCPGTRGGGGRGRSGRGLRVLPAAAGGRPGAGAGGSARRRRC